ncbi:MAG TPA: fused MFS/spermidine synthase [Chloroflexota bacterium]|nr:fused MFS/spermidine synthase [Chloroflexota bacterium]
MLHSLWTSYLVVFLSSACTLVLEIVAGRILAPFIGVSLYTWTSIIGIVLAGISLGNYLGGRLADKAGSRQTLGVLLFCAGLTSLAILPLVAIPNLTGIVPKDAPVVGSFMGRIVILTTMLFFIPSLIMGMVSPVVVKLALTDLSHSGNVVGKIYAFSTLGSIFGTFITGFVLISQFGTRMIVLGVGIILIIMALLAGRLWRSPKIVVALALPLAILSSVISTGTALSSGCTSETNYYCIKVYDEPESDGHVMRVLVLDHLIHSYNSIEDPTYIKYGYIKVYAEFIEYLAQTKPNFSVLFVGGGAYTLPRYIEAKYPQAHIEVIEIDPGVTSVNYTYMGVSPDTKIVTYNLDGRQMVDTMVDEGRKFDLVIGDAFNDLSIPYHLTTKEFDEKIRTLLYDDGFYLTLVIDKLRGGLFIPSYTRTLKQVFPNVYMTADGQLFESSAPNTYVVAGSATPLDIPKFNAVKGLGPGGRVTTAIMPGPELDEYLQTSGGVYLTDDYVPADNLIAPIFAERY